MKLAAPQAIDEPQLELTPLIDVVFQLLVFFMIATSFREPESALGVELPAAASSAARPLEPLVIDVLRDGRVRIGARELAPQELRTELGAALRAAEHDARAPVTLRGDRLARHEDIVRVLDACRAAGVSRFALGTRTEAARP